MKIAKKLASLLLAMVLLICLAAPAFATEGEGGGGEGTGATQKPVVSTTTDNTKHTVTIHAANLDTTFLTGRTIKAYRILDLEIIPATAVDSDPTVIAPKDEEKVNDYLYTVTDGWMNFYADYASKIPLKDENGAVITPETTTDFVARFRDYLAGLTGLGGTGELYADVPAGWPDADSQLYTFARAALKYANTAENNIEAVATATGAEGVVSFGELPQGYYLFVDVTHDGDPQDGQVISALMLRSVDRKTDINVKASLTTIDKVIENGRNDEDGDGEPETKYTNGAIGDCVQFKLTTAVPDTHGFLTYTFTINDTLSDGLTYDVAANHTDVNHGENHEHKMVVTVGGVEVEHVEESEVEAKGEAGEYNIYTMKLEAADPNDGDADKGQKLTIDFPYLLEAIRSKGEAGDKVFNQWTEGAPVAVTYYALINQAAVVVNDSNPNKVNLTYSNNPNVLLDKDGNPTENPDEAVDHPTGTTPDSIVQVLTGEIIVKKVDQQRRPLAGAEFKLTSEKATTQAWVTTSEYVEAADGAYYQLSDGTYTEIVPTAETATLYYQKEDGTIPAYELRTTKDIQELEEASVEKKFLVGEDGLLKFTGLAAGEYVLTETKAPAGYNKLEEPIYFKLELLRRPGTDDADGNADELVNTENPEEDKIDTYYYALYMGKKGEDGSVTYSVAPDKTTLDADAELSITVVNQAGQRLPATGGMGTTLFYVVGAGLALAAVVLLITKKRMNG